MVRKMNRISLYEAIRRQKESQGLSSAPKPGPVSNQGQRVELKGQMKQPPPQPRPVVPVKPVMKPPIRPPLVAKSPFFKKEKRDSGRLLASLREFLKKNPTTSWIGIGGCGILLILVILLFGLQRGQNPQAGPQKAPDKPAKQFVESNKSPVVENTAEKKPQPEKSAPVIIKQEVKPVVAKPEEKVVAAKPAVPEKEVETPKPQPKSQLPAVIQTEMQKQAQKPQPQMPTGTGDHIIVIVAYTKQEHLIPVGTYFRQNGIETEVVQQGGYFLLVTRQRYENPEKTGTDGYKMKQTIKRIGAGYKAPDGFERFSSTPFQDVYGKKVK